MSLLDLTPPSIDLSRAGVLSITPVLLGRLLRLPDGQEIVAARIGPHGEIECLVQGAGLPERGNGEPARLSITCRTEVRGTPFRKQQQFRTIAWWEHDPEKTWVMRDWSFDP